MYKLIEKTGNAYEVNQEGAIRNVRTKRFVRSYISLNGALICNLKNKRCRVARLVAEAFVPNPDPENKTIVGFKDGDRENTNADNLIWLTPAEHVKHAIATGYQKEHSRKTPIIQVDKETGEQLKIYECITTASEATGIPASNICAAIKDPKRSAGGYRWVRPKEAEQDGKQSNNF